MWKLDSTEDIVNAHGIWFKEMGHMNINERIRPGHVLVMDAGGGKEVGFWGSSNSMGALTAGAVGIITSGYCRDTAEIVIQKTPICAAARGRTIIPGRIEVAELEGKIACGGVQVRPGDIVGCDDDGIVVVPIEVAEEVALHAKAVLLADMTARRRHYERLGLPLDETVDMCSVRCILCRSPQRLTLLIYGWYDRSMKTKSSITDAQALLKLLNKYLDEGQSRVLLPKATARKFIVRFRRTQINMRDLELLNEHATYLNDEVTDALDYQIAQ